MSTNDSNASHVRTPHLMCSLEDLLSSTVKGFEKYTILYKVEDVGSSRLVSGDATGQLDSKAEIVAKNVSIYLKAGPFAPTVINHMQKGEPFKAIEVIRLSNVKGENIITSQTTYSNVLIVAVDRDLSIKLDDGTLVDNIVKVTFRYMQEEYKEIVYDQTGTKKGQNVTKYDYGQAIAG